MMTHPTLAYMVAEHELREYRKAAAAELLVPRERMGRLARLVARLAAVRPAILTAVPYPAAAPQPAPEAGC